MTLMRASFHGYYLNTNMTLWGCYF